MANSSGRTLKSVLLVALVAATGCHPRNSLPAKSSKAYTQTVSSFYTGLAALQVGDDVRADSSLERTTHLATGEPAGWVDWGILALRQRNFDSAQKRFEEARKLIPEDDRIYYLMGLVAGQRGDSVAAISNLRQAVALNKKNLRATYQLALETERAGGTDSAMQFKQLITEILREQPNNPAALLELSRAAAKLGDTATLRESVDHIAAQSTSWPPEVTQQLVALQAAATSSDLRVAATRTVFLRNVLMRVPSFRQSMNSLKPQSGEEAQPFFRFVKLESPSATPAPADTALTFHAETLPDADRHVWNWIGAIPLTGDAGPTIAEADARQVTLASGTTFTFPGGSTNVAPTPEGVLAVDFNYDFKTDLVLAGAGGVRFMRQDGPTSFADVTAAAKLPTSITGASYTGAWALDIEADGDMDIVLGAKSGLPLVLRNNGDGTFATLTPFANIAGLRQMVWADLNGDSNPDVGLIDEAGQLHVFINQRSGQFREIALPAGLSKTRALAAADLGKDGHVDLIVVEEDGRVCNLSLTEDGSFQALQVIATVPNASAALASEVRLRMADLDNNGALDMVLAPVSVSSSQSPPTIWLGDQSGGFHLLQTVNTRRQIFDVVDLNKDGKLDLLGLTPDGAPSVLINDSTAAYHWQLLRPRAKQASGDQRINSFGIGGEIEIRSGLLVQRQTITGPLLHFGLGTNTGADVARIVWPNGTVRAEFALKADQSIITEQRLKGSCPFLFAYDGNSMQFVKDAVPWGSAIGLRIDALGSAKINATEEWYKIAGDELAPKDGIYDLRITGELWETYYYDYLSLMVVDHPGGTEIFTDERFVVPAAKPAIITVGSPHQIVSARDDTGRDVTDLVRTLDGKYLDTFGRGQYQGITRDHYVELDLGDDVPASRPLWLIAKGWLHPSDSSINVAIGQGHSVKPKGLSLEVPDGHGGWIVARPNLGFPAGRKKTCMIDLTGIFVPGTRHLLRLRTNLEIYWDSLQWSSGLPDSPLSVVRLPLLKADLDYRGFSTIHQANPSSPELPDYEHLAATTQIWHDLSGYYTRYGDVQDLLTRVDDRYVIMNAGDEMRLQFPAQPPPRKGWVRDYVIAGDGWIKDGDYNSAYSQSVLPLPHHSRKTYDTGPGQLEAEWVYKHHPEDWQLYHTRYVTSDVFDDALRIRADR